ncbi:MAG: MBL fold metallo-hydrolase [Bacteroidales bacterium]|nr:MBL fold metallo-hydrolase [Bacteroidales bacterium]
MKLHLFNIANFKVDGGAMFGVVPKALWSRVYPADENNLVTLTLRSLIIETGEHRILVDTGWGDKQDEKFFRHAYIHNGEGLIKGLAARGFTPEDITDVFLTHLHADHCGGAVKRKNDGDGYELTFPNAVYHISRTQWEWAVKNNPREEDSYPEENILPIGQSGRLRFPDEDAELFPGVTIKICYGHTPGLMIPLISYNGRTIVYTGDLIPTSAHIPLIWNMSYDIESLKSIEEKRDVLENAVKSGHILLFQHDYEVECCTVHDTPKGIRQKDKLLFSDIL